MFSILKQFSSGTRKFSLLVLAYAFCLPLHAQEGAMAKADSLLAAGDSLGAFLWVDSIADNQTYRDQAKAMIYAKYAFTISKQLPDPKHQVNALLGIAQIHFVISDYLPALENALRAKSLALEHNLEEDLGNVFNSIGNVYFMQDDVEKALENWEKSLEYRRKFNTPGAVAGSLNNIAKALIGQGEFDKAELYLKEARKLNQEIDHWRWEIFNLMNFHELEVERMNFKAAEAYAKEGLALSEEKDYLDGAHFFKLYLAELAERKGDEDAALGQYMEVLEDGLTPGNREGYVQTLENAAELARKKGSFQEASELQAEYIRLTDSLHKEDLKGEIANLEVANELLAQSREEEFERQELESA